MLAIPPLPTGAITKMQTQVRQAKSMSSATTGTETVSPVTLTAISLEYASLRHKSHCPLGMYVLPSPDSLLIWDAVFFLHRGYYADAILKFKLIFPRDYPERPPLVQFTTDVFHPLISNEGAFNLSPRFRPWRPKEHHVFDILHWIKKGFKHEALDTLQEHDCLNKEAFRLYREQTQTFVNMASQSTQLSLSKPSLYQQGKNNRGMTFLELKPEQLEVARTQVGLQAWEDPE